jgi:hypothetical protein
MNFIKTIVVTLKANFHGDPELVNNILEELRSEIEDLNITVYSRHNELTLDIDTVVVEEQRESKNLIKRK